MRYPHSNKLLHLACLATSLISAPLHADILEVAGAPPFTSSTNTGFKGDMVAIHPGQGVNNTGTAVAFADKYTAGTLLGMCTLRWNTAGGAELGTLGDNGSGVTTSHPYAINNPGVTVGYAYVYSGSTFDGYRAVRWDAGSTAAIELGNLGLSASGGTLAQAIAINDAGTAVGYAAKMTSAFNFGFRAVRWDAGTTLATELGTLAASATGSSSTQAFAINASGTAVGLGDKFVGTADKGSRAIRWDAGATAATELDALGTNLSGVTESTAYAINAAGTAVGEANKYSGNTSLGARAVRWDAGTTAAVELATLGTNLSGFTDARAYAVNASGMAAGLANKYSGNGNLGTRAVRWDAAGNATELAILSTGTGSSATAVAFALNDAGTVVGHATNFVGAFPTGQHAVAWLPDASVVDLNSLHVVPVPAGGTWVLTEAHAMSDNGWVSGVGTFDPGGGLTPYTRAWVAQVGLGGAWLNTTNVANAWGAGKNWSTGTPAIQLDANFNASATYSVAFDADQSCRHIDITAGHVTFANASHTLAFSQNLTINSGASLAANGILNGNVITAGTFAPGNSPGSVVLKGNYSQTGALELEIASPLLSDTLTVNGNLTLDGAIKIILTGGYSPSGPATFDLLDWTGTLNSSSLVFDFSQAPLAPGLAWNSSQFLSNGTISVQAVPEPATLLVLCLGGATMLARRRRDPVIPNRPPPRLHQR